MPVAAARAARTRPRTGATTTATRTRRSPLRNSEAPEEPRKRFGPRAFFPGKEARPYSVSLTADAAGVMESGQQRTGVSRADFVEACLRKVGPTITRAEIEAIAARA
jgi:hypothetical protein